MKLTSNQKNYIKNLTDKQAIRLYQKLFDRCNIRTWDTVTFKIAHPHLYQVVLFIAFYDGYNLIKGKRISFSKFNRRCYLFDSPYFKFAARENKSIWKNIS